MPSTMLLLTALAAADHQNKQKSKKGIPGITQGIFPRTHSFTPSPIGGPTTAPIADPRSPREIAESRGALLTGLVGDISNLPGIRNTPLGMAGGLMPLVSKMLSPTPYIF